MRPPCETVAKRFIANLRAEVAVELVKNHGWTQEKAARCIGVTQPSISNYIKSRRSISKRGENDIRLSAMQLAEGFASGQLTMAAAVEAMCRLCARSRVGGESCVLHKHYFGELERGDCQACRSLFSSGGGLIRERLETLAELKRAVSFLEQSESFPEVMPEVNVNLVMALSEASTMADVAGIPGRIVKVKGKAKAFMEPEFGVSTHMAKVLLAVMKHDTSIRAAINMRFDQRIEEAMKELGVNYYRIDRQTIPSELPSDEKTLAGIKQAVDCLGTMPHALVDPGEYGIESVVYLCDSTAMRVAQRANHISQKLVERSAR